MKELVVGDRVTQTQLWQDNPLWPKGEERTGTVVAVDVLTVDVDWGNFVEQFIPRECFGEVD